MSDERQQLDEIIAEGPQPAAAAEQPEQTPGPAPAPAPAEPSEQPQSWTYAALKDERSKRQRAQERIIPHGFFCVDPLPGLAEYVANAQQETTFYVAATCDPSVFEALAGHKIEIWFPNQQDKIYPEGATEITGGTSAITRAPFAAHTLGWRDMTIFGADCSFEDTGRYCYRDGTFQEDSKSTFQVVEVAGERFLTDLSLMHQVSQLGVIAQHFKDQLHFDCDGLLSAYLQSRMHKIDNGGRVVLDIEEGRVVVDKIMHPMGRPEDRSDLIFGLTSP